MKESWFAQHIHGDRELTFLFCGRQDSSPGELAGPAVREHYVLYFCLEGRGEYQFRDTHCAIGPGEGFLVPPGEVVSIRADQKEPWKLIWVGFTGCRAAEYLGRCGLGKENRAFRCDVPEQLERCVQEMVRCEMLGRGHEFLLLGELYRFLGWIARSFEGQGRRSREAGTEYVERAADYIRSHFQEDLTVSKLALYVGLNRSYLTTVFQNTLHVSPPAVPDALPHGAGLPAAAGGHTVRRRGGPFLRLPRSPHLLQGIQAHPWRHALPVPARPSRLWLGPGFICGYRGQMTRKQRLTSIWGDCLWAVSLFSQYALPQVCVVIFRKSRYNTR